MVVDVLTARRMELNGRLLGAPEQILDERHFQPVGQAPPDRHADVIPAHAIADDHDQPLAAGPKDAEHAKRLTAVRAPPALDYAAVLNLLAEGRLHSLIPRRSSAGGGMRQPPSCSGVGTMTSRLAAAFQLSARYLKASARSLVQSCSGEARNAFLSSSHSLRCCSNADRPISSHLG